MPALARLAVYQLRSSATTPVASASSGPARRMPKNSSRRLRLIARMATEGPLTGAAERGGQAKYLLWQSYGDIPPEVRLSKVSLTPFPAYFRPMALAPKPEPAGKRTKGRFMSGDAAAAEARIMEGLAREAAGLGVEIVDVAGNIEDV